MEYQGDFLQLYAGLPLVVPNCNLVLQQPKITDIAGFGENKLFEMVSLLGQLGAITQPIKEGNPQLESLPDFQILLIILDESPQLWEELQGFLNFLAPEYEFECFPGGINCIYKDTEKIMAQITVDNFQNFLVCVKTMFLPKGVMPNSQEDDFNPANAQAAAIAEKLRAGRKKVAELNQKKQKTTSVLMNYVSVLTIALKIPIEQLLDMTVFQIYDLHMRTFRKQDYDFYSRLCSTPLMDTSKIDAPDPWMDDLYI